MGEPNEELLRHEPFLGAIVRDIVHNEDVPDVLQKTWLAALQGPRPKPGSMRPWLARVARNFAYEHLRKEANRRAREEAVRLPDLAPCVLGDLQREAIRERVVTAVGSLAEPYRRVIFLRYLQELSYPQIAERLGTNEPAVRKQVQRGLARLRTRLIGSDADPDRRRLAGLLPLGLPRSWFPRFAPGAWFAAASVLLLTGAVLLFEGTPTAGPRDETLARVGRVASLGPGIADARPPEPPSGAQASAVPSRAVLAPHAGRAPGASLRGRVLDPEGRCLGGVEVASSCGARAKTSDDGTFLLENTAAGAALSVPPPYVAVYSSAAPGSTWLADLEEHLLVAARRVRVEGTVQDGAGRALAGVEVEARLKQPIDFPRSLCATLPWRMPLMHTGEDGAFTLADAPAGCVEVVLHQEGKVARVVDVGHGALQRPCVVLETSPAEVVVRGRVVDGEGDPVQGARVGTWNLTVLSGADGSYALPLLGRTPGAGGGGDLNLFVAGAGYVTQERRVSRSSELAVDWCLQAAGVLAGQVLGPDGEPWVGAYVVPWGEPAIHAGLGATDLAQAGDGPEGFFGLPSTAVTRTDERGFFRLAGFGPGEHALGFVDPELSLVHVAVALSAGEEELLICVPSKPTRRVRGRLVDVDGAPVAGVSLDLGLQVLNQGTTDAWRSTGRRVRTDGEGRFDLGGAPRGCRLLLTPHRAPGLFAPIQIEAGSDLAQEWVLEPLRFFRVRIPRGHNVREVARLLDEAGRSVPIVVAHQSSWFQIEPGFLLTDGCSPVLATTESASTLVLDGLPTFAVAFRLADEGVTTIGG